MWLLVMFDLPVLTRQDRKNYRDFHDFLEDDGFNRMQFSVYIRPCATEEKTQTHLDRVTAHLPPDGEVRVLKFTDKQWERMLVFRQACLDRPEEPPEQLVFFDEDLEPLFDELGDRDIENRLWTALVHKSPANLARDAQKRQAKGKRKSREKEPTLDFFD